MISVSITTYNGSKYIIKQLYSIYNQTKKVDEVIICDDCSNDDTVVLIKKFINDNNLSNWRLIINDTRKGFVRNFWDCISLTNGDIVFLSDQDDIWYEKKVETMTRILADCSQIKVLFADMTYIDSNDNRIIYNNHHGSGIISILKHCVVGNIYKINFREFIKTGGYQGASVAFKKEVFNNIKNYNVDNKFAHDVIINFYASLINGFYVTKTKLTKYRLHDKNTLGIPIYKKRNRLEVLSESINICEELKDLSEYLKRHRLIVNFDIVYQYIDQLIDVYKKRIYNIKNKKLFNQIMLLSKLYFFPNFKTYLGDIKNIFMD